MAFYGRGLLPFHRGGGFGGDVVDDAADAANLVYDAHRDAVEQVVGDARPVGGHKVGGVHRAQGEHIVVGSAVAHNADGAQIGQHAEILAELITPARLGDLLAHDEVRLAQRVGALLGDLPDDADGKAGAGEGLARDKLLRQLQRPAKLAHLVLEQKRQRLDNALEACKRLGREQAVMVALDDLGVALAGLDNVGVDGALREKVLIRDAEIVRRVAKDVAELRADDLSLALGVGDAGKLREKALLRVYAHEIHRAL